MLIQGARSTMRNFIRFWRLLSNLFLSVFFFTHNCYAQSSTILSELFDRQVQPREAMALACGVLLVLISPKKYRTKFAGIVAAIITNCYKYMAGFKSLDLKKHALILYIYLKNLKS